MANVKNVEIVGRVPFNLDEHPGAAKYLATLNRPSLGLRITYGECVGFAAGVNEFGGKTALYEFKVSGREAVGVEWVKALIDAFKRAGGEIDKASVYDLEAYAKPSLAYSEVK